MRAPLPWRVFGFFFLLPLVTSLVVTTFLVQQYEKDIEISVRSELQILADLLTAFNVQDPEKLESHLSPRDFSRITDVQMTLLAPGGSVLLSSSEPSGSYSRLAEQIEVMQAIQGIVNYQVRSQPDESTKWLMGAFPISENGQVVQVIHLAYPLDQQTRRIQTYRLQLWILSLALSLLIAVSASYLARRSNLPLERLEKVFDFAISGQFSQISLLLSGHPSRLEKKIGTCLDEQQQKIAGLKFETITLSSVITHMTDGVLIVDNGGNVQFMNPAALDMFSTQIQNAVGNTLAGVSRIHQLVDLWHLCNDTGKQQSVTLETPADRQFLHAIATPLDSGRNGDILLVIQNLTRVRRLETVRQDFVSNVSHELRTPLASLKALTETLNEGALEDPGAARKFLNRMDHEIDNLTQLVQELLELSRIESGKVPLKCRFIAPHDLIEHAFERMQLQAERAGLKMENRCPDNLPEVFADPQRMGQVLINLLHNSIKFTPPGGKVTLNARQESDRVVFLVQDTGVGMSPQSLERIFERFYKTDLARSGGGTGLGLSISRHLVEVHGGQIWVESTLNQGSTFYFSLPTSSQ